MVTCNVKAVNLISEQLKSVENLKFYQDTISMLKDRSSKESDLIIYDACNNKFAKDDISTLLEKPEFKDKTIYILTSRKYPLPMDVFKKNVLGYLIPDEVGQFVKDLNKFVFPQKKVVDSKINKAVKEFESFKENKNEKDEEKIAQKEEKQVEKEEGNIEQEINIKVAELTNSKLSTSSIDISFSINKDKIEEMIITYILKNIMDDVKNSMDEITEAVKENIQEKIIQMVESELKDEIKSTTIQTSNQIVAELLQDKLSSMFGNNGAN